MEQRRGISGFLRDGGVTGMVGYRMESPRAKHLRSLTPQLIADVVLYPAEAGGKKISAAPGWGCPCCPSKSTPVPIAYDCWLLLGDTPLAPGEKRRVGFVFLHPAESVEALRKAGTFYLWEGRFVGEAVVVS
jgi:hypothetical protein